MRCAVCHILLHALHSVNGAAWYDKALTKFLFVLYVAYVCVNASQYLTVNACIPPLLPSPPLLLPTPTNSSSCKGHALIRNRASIGSDESGISAHARRSLSARLPQGVSISREGVRVPGTAGPF